MKHLIFTAVITSSLLLTSCGGRTSSNATKSENKDTTLNAAVYKELAEAEPGSKIFYADFNAATLRNYADYRRAIDHYWDDFPFDADTLVAAYNTSSVMQAMADYVAFIEPQRADSLLRALIHRAERSRPVLDLFASATENILGDPNSPLRNDEYYIPVLEVLVASPLLDEYDRIAPLYDLEMARKNRIGSMANNFEYMLADGSKGWMQDIETDYLIIMFNNPGCPMCKQITEELTSSPMINELTELGFLEIMALYPDEDIEAWRAYLPNMPSSWINAYDPELTISEEKLYSLKAIPSLYLLDKDKRVLIKDSFDVRQIESVLSSL